MEKGKRRGGNVEERGMGSKKKKKKKRKKYKGKTTTVLISTEDSEDNGENWECAGCGEDDGEVADCVGCDGSEQWFHFTCTQLANKAADFVCDFCH